MLHQPLLNRRPTRRAPPPTALLSTQPTEHPKRRSCTTRQLAASSPLDPRRSVVFSNARASVLSQTGYSDLLLMDGTT